MNNIEKIKLLVKEIQNLFFSKKYVVIIQETQKAIKKYPKVSIFYNMLGLALSNIGKFRNAKLVLQKGYNVNPNDLAIINNLANVYKNTFNYSDAEKLYKISITKKKDYFNAYVNYGNLQRDLNKFNEAISLYETALSYNTNVSGIYYSISNAYQALGDFKKAEYYANETLKLDKKFTKADLLISRSKRYTSSDNHLNEMHEKLAKIELNISQKIDLHFALAKAHEDIGEINSSFKYLKEGNSLKRSVIKFDLSFEEKKFTDIKEFFSKIDFNKFKKVASNNKNIIFILGMPRSGTTITEQIISAHSQVYGSGELPYLASIVNEQFIDNKKLSISKTNEILSNDKLVSKISNQYYSYIDNYKISEKYITDKSPLNFMWIGFIRILFPHAKIIHCKRNPKDNCVSLYKNVFEGGINFCYTQNELAKFYNLYEDLMKFWQDYLPNSFLDVEYDKLVTNPQDETKKILDYCDLNWEDNCLNLSNNKTPIKTASVGQARGSIYTTSLNSFSKYEVYLEELFELLKKKSPS
jgi:tetratricopeptide (TPR) repeat protein